jgi:outer membrane protein OmpA-like peptidoglycan-associated protein
VKNKYFIKTPDRHYEGRTIDEKEERVRRLFKSLDQNVMTLSSRLEGKKTNFSVTAIRFPAGDATLYKTAKRFLSRFCADLAQDPDSRGATLYILGLAPEERTEQGQWILSARRAQAVAKFLRDASGARWPVYSWGAGPGGAWVERDSPASRQSQILIAVLRSEQ